MRKASGIDQRRNSVDSSPTQAKSGAYQSSARTRKTTAKTEDLAGAPQEGERAGDRHRRMHQARGDGAAVEDDAGDEKGTEDQGGEQGHAGEHLAHQDAEIGLRHRLPEQHGIVAPVGAEGVGVIEEESHQEVDEPERRDGEQADLEQLERRQEADRAVQLEAVEDEARNGGGEQHQEDRRGGEEEGAAMLEVFALDEGNQGRHLAGPRCMRATKRSEMEGVETLPRGVSRSRSTPSNTMAVWPKRVSE